MRHLAILTREDPCRQEMVLPPQPHGRSDEPCEDEHPGGALRRGVGSARACATSFEPPRRCRGRNLESNEHRIVITHPASEVDVAVDNRDSAERAGESAAGGAPIESLAVALENAGISVAFRENIKQIFKVCFGQSLERRGRRDIVHVAENEHLGAGTVASTCRAKSATMRACAVRWTREG